VASIGCKVLLEIVPKQFYSHGFPSFQMHSHHYIVHSFLRFVDEDYCLVVVEPILSQSSPDHEGRQRDVPLLGGKRVGSRERESLRFRDIFHRNVGSHGLAADGDLSHRKTRFR
jgi:hypothetical protein